MSTPPQVSVIIASYNTRSLLDACLRSTLQDLRQSGLSYEIIVVDDASTDGSAELVAVGFPSVRLICNSTTKGYTRASNRGIRQAMGAAIFLLNSDTVVRTGATRAMFDALFEEVWTGAVGPKLLNPDGSHQRSCYPFPMRGLLGNTLPLFRLGLGDDYRSWDHRADRAVDWLVSAALMVKRSVLYDVGLFDEMFWVSGADIDWALRARRKGYRLVALARPEVVHISGASWGALTNRRFAEHMSSNVMFFRKHYGNTGAALYRAIIFLNSLIRLVLWGFVGSFGSGRSNQKAAYFRRLARWSLTGAI